MQFGWDAAKSEWNLQHRGFDFRFASRVFRGPTVDVLDTRKAYGEPRTNSYGYIDNRLYVVGWTPRAGETRWIFTARKCNARERTRYGAP